MDIEALTDEEALEAVASELFERLLGDGWDPEKNPHQRETARRYVNSLQEILKKDNGFQFTTFPNTKERSEMVTVGPVFFSSVCAHHVLPFFGNAWVAYVPDKKIAGLSKLARTIKWMSRGLWTQEDLSYEIATFLEENLEPIGTAVLMEAEHLCMTIRGVQSPGTITSTSEMMGCFLDPEKQARMEFYNNVRR